VAGVADAAQGLERPFLLVLLQEQHRPLFGAQMGHAALGDQVEDLFQRQRGIDGNGDLVEDPQLFDRALQAQVFPAQAPVFLKEVLPPALRVLALHFPLFPFVNDFND